ncbi:MAG: MBL fold metallo-hydrolase, partial [Candidatus Nomurabacteria bacterium]|nr:MBL fold metallo-hydrolase [Candidatus Nomurabacteria bacterium]
MKLQFTGTGTFGTKNRALTSFLINDEMLLDAGNGTVRGLQNSGAELAKIKYLVITHFHLDHWPDALLLIMKRYVGRIGGSLTIVSPVGFEKIITDTLTTYMSDVGSAEELLGDTKFIELTDDEIVIDSYKIVARTVLHGDCTPVSGYEIAVGDARLGFSGDSTKCSGL